MDQRKYIAPEACELPYGLEYSVLVTSGRDKYHDGGGGRYGDDDLNINDYVY